MIHLWPALHRSACALIALSGFAISAILFQARRRLRADPLGREVFGMLAVMLAACALSRLLETQTACTVDAWQAAADVVAAAAWIATATAFVRLWYALTRREP